jgi:hypothetical protein
MVSIDTACAALAAPVLSVSDPLIDKLPDERANSIAITKWVQAAEETGLSATKKVDVKTKDKSTDKSPKYLVMSSLTVNFAPIKETATAAEIEAANRAYKINVNLKLIDLGTGKILNSASTLFRGSEWKGWPTATDLSAPKFVETSFGHELMECIQDGCSDLLSKLPDEGGAEASSSSTK